MGTIKYLSMAALVAGLLYAQFTGYYKAQIANNRQNGAQLEEAISSQREYNANYKTRIATKSRVVSILSGYHDTLHHDPALLAELIMQKSEQHGLDPFLVLGMIQAESGFNSRAVSSKGARGLMQLRPNTATLMDPNLDFAVENVSLISDNEINISLGTRYMAKMIRRFGNLESALEAYNRGPEAMHRQITGEDDFEPHYSGKVIYNYRQFKSGKRL